MITGRSMSSPCEALRAETTVNSTRTLFAKTLRNQERMLFVYPRRLAFEGVCRSRLKRRDARYEAEHLCKELGEHHSAPFESFTGKPGERGLGKVSVFPALSAVSGRMTMWDTIRIAAEERADLNVYTDGLMDGGAGIVVTRGNFGQGCENHTTDKCPIHLFL